MTNLNKMSETSPFLSSVWPKDAAEIAEISSNNSSDPKGATDLLSPLRTYKLDFELVVRELFSYSMHNLFSILPFVGWFALKLL